MTDYTQWSSAARFFGLDTAQWVPEEDRERIAAYSKYDQIYWNEPRQFALRVLEGEEPLYIPNARIVVDTTAHYVLKGLQIVPEGDAKLKTALTAFLDREMFEARFSTAKLSGVARGDFAFHMTANPQKAQGTRISLNSVDPSSVFPIYDEDIPDKMIGCHIAMQYTKPDDPGKIFVRKLTYRLDETGETRRVSREEGLYELEPKWYGPKAKLVKVLLAKAYLDPRITAIPVYWFKNRAWDGEDFGSSELRGFESMLQTISQGATDVSASLALEGLGVYATDGGRPVNDQGVEVDWEVSPGRVMEVPQGSYFRRVEGVSSITPAKDQIDYIENKIMEASSLSDVARGQVDAQVAQSGIALAIKFMPTLAKIEDRDKAGVAKLKQLFFDWKTWHEVFEREALDGEVLPVIGDKLPQDRVARVNELNNMLDRRVISTKYYRQEMEKLGYKFPSNIEDEIKSDLERVKSTSVVQFEEDAPVTDTSGVGSASPDSTLDNNSSSNNRNRPNESSGTEAQ